MEKLKLNLQLFSSTNKTTYYDLSQYIGTDKPTYLVDYNGDMGKIDTALHTIAGVANTADGTATANSTKIGTLSSLTTTDKTDLVSAINEVDSNSDVNATNIATNTSHIGTLSNLETLTKADLVNAINELKTNIDNFNLTSYTTMSNLTAVNGTITNHSVKVAKNSDGSLAKVYGTIAVTPSSGTGFQEVKITIPDTGLAPSSDITINNAGILRSTGEAYSPTIFDMTIKTDGSIEIVKDLSPGVSTLLMLMPCLYFVKDFGDVPLPD